MAGRGRHPRTLRSAWRMKKTGLLCLCPLGLKSGFSFLVSFHPWILYFLEILRLTKWPTSGTWQQQREIARSAVTVIKFVQDGNALIGGCRDGVL